MIKVRQKPTADNQEDANEERRDQRLVVVEVQLDQDMIPSAHRRWLWTLSALSLICLAFAGYWFVRWGLLRVQVALGEEQTQMFEECRTQALQSSDPKRIAGLIQAAIIYYPSGTKQSIGSHVDRLVERSRHLAIDDMIAQLRVVTGADLGKDPQSWIDRYGEKEMVQPDREASRSQPTGSQTNQLSRAAGSGR